MRYAIPALVALSACLLGCQSAPAEKPVSETLAEDLPAVTSIVITQREWAYVPGSDGLLILRIDVITAGATLVRLSMTKMMDDLVPRLSMSVGDIASFSLGKREFALGMSHMVNRLIGDDYAQFHIGDPKAVCTAQITAILARIESSSSTFLLDGKDCDGKTMTLHLRQKTATSGDTIRTGADFIDQIATQTAPGGSPYGVYVLQDKPTALATWIRGRRK